MPLFTDQISSARAAYALLEQRTISAEQRSSQLAAALGAIRDGGRVADVAALLQRIADLEGQVLELHKQLDAFQRSRSDTTLQQFIESLALSAALGEASMPGRSISSLSAQVNAHVSVEPDGIALRFQAPEAAAADPATLSTTQFVVAKLPPAAGEAAPANFYTLLLQTQDIAGRANQGTRFSALAGPILVTASRAIADAGGWNFAYLLGVTAALAELYGGWVASDHRPETAALGASSAALATLTRTLAGKPNPVAGDLYALTAAFADTIRAAAFAAINAP